jgi:hypothetical protein
MTDKDDNVFGYKDYDDSQDINKYPVTMEYGYHPDSSEGYRWLDHTIEVGKAFKYKRDEFRRCVFFLVLCNIAKVTDASENNMFSRIRLESGLDKSTIHDYVKAAKVESKLNITQGVMSIDALTYLAEHAAEEKWKPIFDLGMSLKEEAFTLELEQDKGKKRKKNSSIRSNKTNPYLTKSQLEDALRQHEKIIDLVDNSKKSKPTKSSNVISIRDSKSKEKPNGKQPLKRKEFLKPKPERTPNQEQTKRSNEKQSPKSIDTKIDQAKTKLLKLSTSQKDCALNILLEPRVEEKIAYFLLRQLKPEDLKQFIKELKNDIKSHKQKQ